MRPLDYPLLADENIHPSVVAKLREAGKNIQTVSDVGLTGATDSAVIAFASAAGRVLLTHDADFGRLMGVTGQPVIGVIYIRPGHISPLHVGRVIEAIEASDREVERRFVLVAELRDARVRLRLRRY